MSTTWNRLRIVQMGDKLELFGGVRSELRSEYGDMDVLDGMASVGEAAGDSADRDGRERVHQNDSDPCLTLCALRSSEDKEPMLTPEEFLKQIHLYAGQGTGGVRSWLQAAMVGLGITTYVGHVIGADNTDNIHILLKDLTGDEPLRVVSMASPNMSIALNNQGGRAPKLRSGEATYIIKDRGFAFVNNFGPSHYSCAFDFFWKDLSEEEQNAFKRFYEREDATKCQDDMQQIFMLVDYGNGDFNFHSNKIALSGFKKENYSDENVAWMPRLKEGIFSPTSSGRLSIFQGPAGTGKTRYLRALMQEMGSNTAVIVLPVSLAGELSHPRMLGQITANSDFEGKNLLLIIEDGDGLLEKRDHASSVISDFLNIVDGLVGEIVNLHVVVTTNLQKKDFDPAITRPGRLHSILYFEAIPYEQAAKVYRRETGEDLDKNKDNYTLAEVYSFVNNHNNGVREKLTKGSGQYL